MITKEEREKLREIIGERHIAQLSNYLIEEKIFNRFDEPYTSVFISRVFNGRVQNKYMEQIIWNFAEKRKNEDEEEQERRKAILSS